MDYARRLATFRARLDQRGVDAWYLVNRSNVRYLSGFTGADSTLLVSARRILLVTDSRYGEQAAREIAEGEVLCRKGPMIQMAGTLLGRLGVKTLGVAAGNLTHADFVALGKEAPSADVIAFDEGIADRMRLCKDEDEIAAIRGALDLAQRTWQGLVRRLEPGRSEKWVAARLEFEMRAAGADGASFETICAVDANASKPHAIPSDDRIRPECTILFDWGARVDGYCSDLTRVACLGRIPTKLRELAQIVMAAQQAAFEKLKPGVSCAEPDAAARTVIAEAGYGDFFGHGLGHGVGLEVHEEPRLGPGADIELQPGMVVTVEPGVYLPGRMGVRIEEMVRITPDGCEVLTTLPRAPERVAGAGS